MTIKELIEKLQALAADPKSGATLETPVKIDVAMESGNADIRTVFVWPSPTEGDYVAFSADPPEEVAQLIASHRKYLAQQQDREPTIGDRVEVMYEHTWRAAEVVGLEPSKVFVAVGDSILSCWLADRGRLWRFAA